MTSEVPYGYCHCGCGERTRLAPETSRRAGWVKGQPLRYVYTHQIPRVPAHVEEPGPLATPCHVWRGRRNDDGYALQTVEGGSDFVHRRRWIERHGAVAEGHELDHLCRNRACVNPEHLESVTHLVNVRRGRRPRLGIERAREIKSLLRGGWGVTDIASAYGVNPGTVSHIRSGLAWADA